jgi:hypothetical protein
MMGRLNTNYIILIERKGRMISKRNYFTIIILMLMVFVMFMFAGVSSNILSDITTNNRVEKKIDINSSNTITAASLNLDTDALAGSGTGRSVLDPGQKLQAAILSEGTDEVISRILVEWCVYNKYLYKIYNTWPDTGEMAGYDIVLFGDFKVTSEDTQLLFAYAELGTIMIFTQLPGYQEISSDRNLADFFGIRDSVNDNVVTDGIKIFSDFMLSKERIYTKGDYFGDMDDTQISVPYYTLREGYEVYAVGLLDNQEELAIKDKDLPPLLWRTSTDNSFVCVVNSDIFDGMSMLGVLTGFMAQQGEYYLYPIVNAQTISLIDYPYFSDENDEAVQKLYSRGSEAVARDILWPNIIQILKNYGGSYSFFAAPELNYQGDAGPQGDYIGFYLREIDKLPGTLGLSLGQVSGIGLKDMVKKNEMFFKSYLPEYDVTALYAADFHTDEVKSSLNYEFFKNISLVMSDYIKGDDLISFLDEEVLSVKFNLDGSRHETGDDLQMICIENALGMCNMKMDIGRVIYPEDSFDEWNYLSLKWSRGDTYFKDFSMLDMVSVYEMENRVRRFLSLDYTYEYNENKIDIYIDHFDEEAYFMLFTNLRSIDYAENATAKKISDTAYLIKATAANVRIHITNDNILKKPRNNKSIPSNPE